MKSWDIELSESFNLEGKIVSITFFKNEHSYPFADIKLEVGDGKTEDVEFPITPTYCDGDVNFLSIIGIDHLIDRRVLYNRNAISFEKNKVRVVYCLEVIGEKGPAYVEVVNYNKERKN